jgi:hypothetical protein
VEKPVETVEIKVIYGDLIRQDRAGRLLRKSRAWQARTVSEVKKACHSELVEESALEVTAHASACEFPTRWKRTQVPRELRPQVQILRLRGCAAPLRMTLFLCGGRLNLFDAHSPQKNKKTRTGVNLSGLI